MNKDTSVIPFGQYCYTDLTPNGPNLKIKSCPYWSINKEHGYQENGYCSYLEVGDWQEEAGFGLLWDQVKLCDVNEEYEKDKLTDAMKDVYNNILKNTRDLDPECAKTIDENFWELI